MLSSLISVKAKQETVAPVRICSPIENSLSEAIGGKLHDTRRFLCLQLSYQERLRAQFRMCEGLCACCRVVFG